MQEQQSMAAEREKVVYRGGPSQVVNYNTFTICVILFLLALGAPGFFNKFLAEAYGQYKTVYMMSSKALFFIPILWSAIAYLRVSCHKYTLTTERLKEEEGILSKTTDELELFRVKDITYVEPFSLRMFGCGNIILDTSDKSTPIVVLYAIKGGRQVLDQLRKNVQIMRQKKGVREID